MRKIKIKELFIICYKSEYKNGYAPDNESQVFEQIDVRQIKGTMERDASLKIRRAAHMRVIFRELPIDVT